jgi:hypothetical protein
METREEPRFITFEKGEVYEGVLVAIERVQVGTPPKPSVRYTIQGDNGKLGAFLGTYQLNTKLHTEDKGHRVAITYTGENEAVKRGDNCMKVFDVKVSRERITSNTTAAAGLGISDEDIPF